MKKFIIYCIYIILFISITLLEIHIYMNKDSYYINFYDLFGKYKSQLINEKILENGLKIDDKLEYKDIKKLRINNTEGYGYLVTYEYTNRKISHSEWVKDHNMYIEYIISNRGYNGSLIYNNYYNMIKYIIYCMLIIPFIIIFLNKLKSKNIK